MLFLPSLEGEGRPGELGENHRGKGEGFVLALWMSTRVELNCQLMRFPNHRLPFKSGPTDWFPRQQQQGASCLSASLKARESPEQVQEGWSHFWEWDWSSHSLPCGTLVAPTELARVGLHWGPLRQVQGSRGTKERPCGFLFPKDRRQAPLPASVSVVCLFRPVKAGGVGAEGSEQSFVPAGERVVKQQAVWFLSLTFYSIGKPEIVFFK